MEEAMGKTEKDLELANKATQKIEEARKKAEER
jgi:hypothetical protein